MCLGTPKPQAIPPPPPTVTPANPAVQASLDRERRRQMAAAGRQSTILTGGAGLAPATGLPKTALGM